ncbi:MAG: gluconate 2-dehydrogenase subunit 3 family protein [Gemmatimonadota bacterium]|nr:gluconate 2-dehydrogenase subunit 3 family protein [Gemmatimonadota bacterium]MDH3477757.1 gluconate 2-dehydrogenase subunit 3 family protein [Gemmatimonadota bacterium]MDH3569816.1 gluconate 2-dehydrogenase subunit 3 family protein [Gemmatimonadota bacterium]MDH5548519.1 gluconate 2-dehydrogenase subunit 3 family protein [Gemmatimonadota bacterium]
MLRRDVIRAVATGLALPTIDALTPEAMWAAARAVHNRIRRARQDGALLALSEHQNAMVSVLAELIIPETDTPGATAAQVNRFVDVMLAEWFDEDGREAFLRGLVALDARSVNTFGTPFLELDEVQQSVLLRGLDAELAALRQLDRPTNDHFFQQMKWLTLYGYYTSEVGATQELEQVIAPGRYDPCGPVRREASGQWE